LTSIERSIARLRLITGAELGPVPDRLEKAVDVVEFRRRVLEQLQAFAQQLLVNLLVTSSFVPIRTTRMPRMPVMIGVSAATLSLAISIQSI
jgi:hypothetical protein